MADRNFFAWLAVLVGCCFLVSGCSNSSDFSGQAPQISDADAVVVFQVFDPAHDNVTFMHRQHAETWNQACFVCHSHFNVRTDGAWKCAECHSNNDTEGLCADDANNHDCMTVQCKTCHQDLAMVPGGDPTPNCVDCHKPLAVGVFVDSPVQGLIYQTVTQSGITNSSGTFTYLAGETIAFYVGDVLLGSALAKSVISPLDLVPGALNTADQTVTNIARFLQSIDDDQLPDVGGITIPANISSLTIGRVVDFNAPDGVAFSTPDVLAIVQGVGHPGLVDETTARDHLQATLVPGAMPVTPTTAGSSPGFTGVLSSSTDIHTYSFTLVQTMDVTIDVESWESKDYVGCAHTGSTCSNCHGAAEAGSSDLGLTPGCSNDKLITNIYLFADDPVTGSLIDSRVCQLSSCGGADLCYPGFDAPGACISRDEHNPYLDRTTAAGQALGPGVYYLKIGAAGLSLADARSDPSAPNNSDGWHYDNLPGATYFTYSGDKYRVNFSFN